MRDSVSIPNHKIRSSVKFLKGCDDRRPRLERPEPGHVAEMWFRRGRRRIYRLHARHIEDAYSRSDCSQVNRPNAHATHQAAAGSVWLGLHPNPTDGKALFAQLGV